MGYGLSITGFSPNAMVETSFATGALSGRVADPTLGKIALGVSVERAAAALPQTSAAAIFTISGGRIRLRQIIGIVTVVIGAVANATKLKHVSTIIGPTTTDISGTLELNAAAAGAILSITGTFANAMLKTADVPVAVQATELMLPPGDIRVDCAGSDGGTGRVKWVCVYVPLEIGATVAAA